MEPIPLCPNCHTLYHILDSAEKNADNESILKKMLEKRDNNERLIFLFRLRRDASKWKAEYQRVTDEMMADPDRLLKMHDEGKSAAQIFSAYHYFDGVKLEVLPFDSKCEDAEARLARWLPNK